MFKIGQSLDPAKRAYFLEKTWGPIDYESSYMVQGSSGKELETTLHFLLRLWNLVFKPGENRGEGYTEWFEVDAFQLALDEIARISELQGVRRDVMPISQWVLRPESVCGDTEA